MGEDTIMSKYQTMDLIEEGPFLHLFWMWLGVAEKKAGDGKSEAPKEDDAIAAFKRNGRLATKRPLFLVAYLARKTCSFCSMASASFLLVSCLCAMVPILQYPTMFLAFQMCVMGYLIFFSAAIILLELDGNMLPVALASRVLRFKLFVLTEVRLAFSATGRGFLYFAQGIVADHAAVYYVSVGSLAGFCVVCSGLLYILVGCCSDARAMPPKGQSDACIEEGASVEDVLINRFAADGGDGLRYSEVRSLCSELEPQLPPEGATLLIRLLDQDDNRRIAKKELKAWYTTKAMFL